MLQDIPPELFLAMTAQEKRWLDNIKKAFHQSDLNHIDGRPEDRSLIELCQAINTAKTLRRSLRGEATTRRNNKSAFVEFLHLEVPGPDSGGLQIELFDAVENKSRPCAFGDLVYEIRCMGTHEGENLNIQEGANHHVLIDWTSRSDRDFGVLQDGRLVCNGHSLWQRLREVLTKFITWIEAVAGFAGGAGSFSVGVRMPLGSVKPGESTQRRAGRS